MKKKDANETKMTVYEYEQKYTKRQNSRSAGRIIRLSAVVVGAVLFYCLLSVALKVYEINEYAGYAAGGICLLLFIFLFIVPTVKLLRTGFFMTNVNANGAAAAKRHNRKLRLSIAEKMIDFTAKADGAGWYDSEAVGRLAIAVKAGDDAGVKNVLTELYSGSVKRSARDMIFKSALKSGLLSAVSQAPNVDSAIVAAVNLQLIKDIVFLYGFRPSDAKLAGIFFRVVQNSLVAYGLGGVKVGGTVVKTMGDVVKGIPLLGAAISTVVDSSVQGLANASLTAVIGYQTIRYLNTEYRLQSILDEAELPGGDDELKETCTELEKELRGSRRQTA